MTQQMFLIPLFSVFLLASGCAENQEDRRLRSDKSDNIEVFGSCSGSCETIANDGDCWCDSFCAANGDCCSDIGAFCGETACDVLLASDCELRADCEVGAEQACQPVTSCEGVGSDTEACTARPECQVNFGSPPTPPTCSTRPVACEELGASEIESCGAREECEVVFFSPPTPPACVTRDTLACEDIGTDVETCDAREDCEVTFSTPPNPPSCSAI